MLVVIARINRSVFAGQHEYYAVETNENGQVDENCFPYWTTQLTEAYNFGSSLAAQNEMQMNEFPEDAAILTYSK